MILSIKDVKTYLRAEYDDEDGLIKQLLLAAERICKEVLRTDEEEVLSKDPNAKVAILYIVAYLYEHREEADHSALMLSLRALLGGSRKVVY